MTDLDIIIIIERDKATTTVPSGRAARAAKLVERHAVVVHLSLEANAVLQQQVHRAVVERGEGLNGAIGAHRDVDLIEEARQDGAVVLVAVIRVKLEEEIGSAGFKDAGGGPVSCRCCEQR